MRRTLIALLALLTFGAALAACGDDSGGDDESKDETEQEAPADDESADDEAAAEPTGPATVSVADTGIGEVLVGPDGKTLYLYASDQGTTSAVPANILSAWPPLTVESADAAVAGEGVDQSKLGTAPQPDGTIWVTYNGHLLYAFSGDAAAGDTNGHKLGNIWFALTPAGEQAA
jgi:predicted lipoprotein with Yx(FWY)xxD motif